jgi:hypothetical protein
MSSDATKAESSTVIAWSKNIPLVTNSFIMKDMAIVVGLASLVLLVILLVISGGEGMDGMIMLWAVCTAFVLGAFLIACIFVLWNRIGMQFKLNAEGAGVAMGSRERKMNTAVTIIGALARSPGTAGAGLLAKSSESMYVTWPEVKKVTVYRKQKVIDLRVGLIRPLRLYCTAENYQAVERMIREKAGKASFREKNGPLF